MAIAVSSKVPLAAAPILSTKSSRRSVDGLGRSPSMTLHPSTATADPQPAALSARPGRSIMTHMATTPEPKSPRLPPRWVIRGFWVLHRGIYRLTGGRRGLSRPKPNTWGMMRLTTVGRKGGKTRSAILGYYEDGPNLVTLAMNGWAEPEPAWWLNLQANPDAIVDLKGESRAIHGRVATAEERPRLWAHWHELGDDVDGYATRRPTETAVVVLEPRA